MPLAVRRLVYVLAVMAAALAACSGDDGPSATTASTTVPELAGTEASPGTAPPPTTTAADLFAIPEVIDAAYVNRVLAELYRIDGDVLRTVLAKDLIEFEDVRPLRGIYNDPQYEIEVENLLEVKEDEADFLTPPGDRTVTVVKLLQRSASCIAAVVLTDFSAVVHRPPVDDPAEQNFIVLTPTPPSARNAVVNPTPWSIERAIVIAATTEPRDPCG